MSGDVVRPQAPELDSVTSTPDPVVINIPQLHPTQQAKPDVLDPDLRYISDIMERKFFFLEPYSNSAWSMLRSRLFKEKPQTFGGTLTLDHQPDSALRLLVPYIINLTTKGVNLRSRGPQIAVSGVDKSVMRAVLRETYGSRIDDSGLIDKLSIQGNGTIIAQTLAGTIPELGQLSAFEQGRGITYHIKKGSTSPIFTFFALPLSVRPFIAGYLNATMTRDQILDVKVEWMGSEKKSTFDVSFLTTKKLSDYAHDKNRMYELVPALEAIGGLR